MAVSLKAGHIGRYSKIARLFMKYGRNELLNSTVTREVVEAESREEQKEVEITAEEFARDLEEMGPIFIKLGQVLSSRSDLLPPPYLDALSRLQDNLEPFPFAEVERIIPEELGVRLSKAFADFDPDPIGVASLGQVHRATLRDGRPVVVKVQRPGIRKQIADDMEALTEIAQFADDHTRMGQRYQFVAVLEEFKKNLLREMDYRQEARHLDQLADNLREFETIVVPRPIADFTTGRVLTMDFVQGRKITDLGPLAQLEMDGARLAEDLFRAYLQQILLDGFFHADPHPGNVFVTNDHRIALIDLGMVGHITPAMQDRLLKMLLATSEGRSEEAADVALKMGERLPDFNEAAFRRQVGELVTRGHHASVEEMQIGRVMLDLSQTSGENGVRLPSELTMLGKALLNLDEIGRVLAPEFNPNESIRRNATQIVNRRLLKGLSPNNVLSTVLEARELAQEMPGRINRLLDLASSNQLRMRVDAIDEGTLIEGFQKVANRITMGLVLAALIIGAAMLMRVETKFTLFGYPGLAMVCFLLAAGGGFGLILSILLSDRSGKEKKIKPSG